MSVLDDGQHASARATLIDGSCHDCASATAIALASRLEAGRLARMCVATRIYPAEAYASSISRLTRPRSLT
jgi:hypothetical protein